MPAQRTAPHRTPAGRGGSRIPTGGQPVTGTWGRGSTRAWRTTRARILTRDPRCRIAGPGCTGTSTEVDHIRERADGGTDHDDNLRGTCAHCHERKTRAHAAHAAARRARTRTTGRRHPNTPT